MQFKHATDQLADLGVSLADLAWEMGVSHQALRQARMAADATGFRNPPEGWRPALAKLARERAAELVRLAEAADGGPSVK